MKNPELYQKTVQILYDAYMNDTLMHGNCCACAVGNIIAANCGFKVKIKNANHTILGKSADWIDGGRNIMPLWGEVFATANGVQKIYTKYLDFSEIKQEFDSSGYQWQDLAKIEKAFETAKKGKSSDEWMFNGLMAVINELDIIHENTDLIAMASTKNKFIKSLNTPTCTTSNYDTK